MLRQCGGGTFSGGSGRPKNMYSTGIQWKMNIFKSFNFSLAKKRSWSRLKISAPVLAKKPRLRPAPQHCNQEPNVILTLIVFWFFKDLKLTDVKSNKLRKCKNNMFWIRSRSRSRSRNLAGARNVKKGRLRQSCFSGTQCKWFQTITGTALPVNVVFYLFNFDV